MVGAFGWTDLKIEMVVSKFNELDEMTTSCDVDLNVEQCIITFKSSGTNCIIKRTY